MLATHIKSFFVMKKSFRNKCNQQQKKLIDSSRMDWITQSSNAFFWGAVNLLINARHGSLYLFDVSKWNKTTYISLMQSYLRMVNDFSRSNFVIRFALICALFAFVFELIFFFIVHSQLAIFYTCKTILKCRVWDLYSGVMRACDD